MNKCKSFSISQKKTDIKGGNYGRISSCLLKFLSSYLPPTDQSSPLATPASGNYSRF